jgi:Family of unknown function (DUF6088)
MTVAANIKEKIKRIPNGTPFGYAQLGIAAKDFNTAAKAIERLQKKGFIKKVSKGQFYKPQVTVFGELGPDYDKVLQNYLYKGKKRVGYITGGELYNQLRFNTQISATTTVATNVNKKNINLGWLKTKTVKAYATINDNNYKYLGILDAIKDAKKIQDCSVNKATEIIIIQLNRLQPKEMEALLKYALQYPPRVRALLGAILQYKFKFDVSALLKSLNPSTVFKLNITCMDASILKNWNIK